MFVWWATDDESLGHAGRAKILSTPDVYVSAAAFWEICIKAAKGGSGWDATTAPGLYSMLSDFGFKELPVKASDTFAVATLTHPGPKVHKDPFDRLMVVQARAHGFELVTSDAQVALYGLNIVKV
ncbi:MAG: twitching motility protein PilT [Rhizobacter sp.]|nr:twitching motility protein PilT [Rhizobacter sp.]